MHSGTVAEWGMVVFATATATATAYFAWVSSVSSKRIEFLIGALESHSTMQLRMDAWDRKLKVIAYDPATDRYPARVPSPRWRGVVPEYHLSRSSARVSERRVSIAPFLGHIDGGRGQPRLLQSVNTCVSRM